MAQWLKAQTVFSETGVRFPAHMEAYICHTLQLQENPKPLASWAHTHPFTHKIKTKSTGDKSHILDRKQYQPQTWNTHYCILRVLALRQHPPEDADELRGHQLRPQLLHLRHVPQESQHVPVQLLLLWELLGNESQQGLPSQPFNVCYCCPQGFVGTCLIGLLDTGQVQ